MFLLIKFSVDGRDSQITEGDHWSSDLVLERRANFTWTTFTKEIVTTSVTAAGKSSGLVLRSLVTGDAAIYRCRVDYREAQTKNLLINLTVIGKSSLNACLPHNLVIF